jgi:hypothetical protein
LGATGGADVTSKDGGTSAGAGGASAAGASAGGEPPSSADEVADVFSSGDDS